MFKINQIVSGETSKFIILGFRMLGGEMCAEVKQIDERTGKAMRGEMSVHCSLSSLTA